MLIYIPTYGRSGKQITLRALPDRALKRVVMVVRPEEAKAFPGFETLVCAKPGVPAARQAALDHANKHIIEKAFFFDDDLRFARRPRGWNIEKGNVKLEKATCGDIEKALNTTEGMVSRELPMVGWDARGGNDRRPEHPFKPFCRVMRAFCVHVPTLRHYGIRFDRFPFWEDFHVALSLIEAGKTIGNLMTMTNDGVTNSKGGVSTYRNVEALRKCREEFCKRHPFAKPVEKTPKSWDVGGATVPDLVIYWQKAAKAAEKAWSL